MKRFFFIFYCVATMQSIGCVENHAVLQRALRSAQAVPSANSICHDEEGRYEAFVLQQALKHDDKHGFDMQLFEICRDDKKCCKAYKMSSCTKVNSSYTDFETFRYLKSHWHTSGEPLTELLDTGGYCGNRAGGLVSRGHVEEDGEPLQNVLKYAWLVEMRLQMQEHSLVRCSENEHFVYSPEDAEGRCVCNAEDADECHNVRRYHRSAPWNYSMTAIIVASSAATVLFVLQIIALCQQLNVYSELIKEDSTGTTQRKRFLNVLSRKSANIIR